MNKNGKSFIESKVENMLRTQKDLKSFKFISDAYIQLLSQRTVNSFFKRTLLKSFHEFQFSYKKNNMNFCKQKMLFF